MDGLQCHTRQQQDQADLLGEEKASDRRMRRVAERDIGLILAHEQAGVNI